MRKNSLPLNIRIFAMIMIAVMLTSSAVLLGSFKLFSETLKDRFEDKIIVIGQNAAVALTFPILTGDTSQLESLSVSLLNDPDIGGIRIYDKNKNIILEKGNTKGKIFSEFPIKLLRSNLSIIFNPKQTEEILGYISIYYSENQISGIISRLFMFSAMIVIVIAFIMIVVVFRMLNLNMIKPLNHLIDVAEQVGEGNLDIKVKDDGFPEIRQLASSFESMINSLKESRERLAESYEKLSKQKSLAELGKFSLVIAHEFKNPLGIIKGALDVIEKENVSEEIKEKMLGYSHEEIKRLDNLIKEFLTIQKPQEPKISECDLKSLLSNIIEKMKLRFPTVSIELAMEPENFFVKTDSFIIERIIINLIKNSIEASADSILIVCIEEKLFWEISVIDNGCGIEEEKLDKIFEPFFTTKKEGTGLGLVIVSQMIASLNGFVKVDNNKDKGLTFKIYFNKDGVC
jgi:signal transduction histidine kinase